MRPLFDPGEFTIPAGVHHLCAGGKSAVLRCTETALLRFLQDKTGGKEGDIRQEAEVERLTTRLARFWSVPDGDVGLCSSVAEGVSILAESWDWRPGDNVVAVAHEYPSLAAPFAALPGVELRVVPDLAALRARADSRTRMVLASHVSFLDAERADLPGLREAADRVGAALVLDHTQAAGWCRIGAGIEDFGLAACYKWMLGITGIAIAHWNRARQPGWAPRTAGWHSIGAEWRPDWPERPLVPGAMRFNRGNPNHAGAYALHAALDFLEIYDAAALEAHVLALAGELRARCLEAGLPMLTPINHGASVCLPHPDTRAAIAALNQRGVWAWGGRGRIRVSFHGYNGGADLDSAFTALREVFSAP